MKNMRTLQPPNANLTTQAKIANAQNLVTKSSKGRLSGKVPPGAG